MSLEHSDQDLAAAERKASQIRGQNGVYGPISYPWPKHRPKYLVQVWLRDTGARFVCVGLDVTQIEKSSPISSTLMRDLPVAEIVGEAIRRLLSHSTAVVESIRAEPAAGTGDMPLDEGFAEHKAAFLSSAAAHIKKRQQATGEGPGRRWPPGHLDEVARIVRNARRQGLPTGAAVVEAFGISPSAAANQISRARARGLIETEEER
jgi:hypothetical protein